MKAWKILVTDAEIYVKFHQADYTLKSPTNHVFMLFKSFFDVTVVISKAQFTLVHLHWRFHCVTETISCQDHTTENACHMTIHAGTTIDMYR